MGDNVQYSLLSLLVYGSIVESTNDELIRAYIGVFIRAVGIVGKVFLALYPKSLYKALFYGFR